MTVESRGDRVRSRNKAGGGAVAILMALTVACSSSGGLVPVSYPDPGMPCPAGRTGWRLEVLDRRAQRDGSEGVVSLLEESIRRSFPGCGWDGEAGGNPGQITIEVHRFTSLAEGNTWDATAEWTVVARDAGGRVMTEFDAREEVSRPNYRGANNARESLREAFDRAIRKTLTGLRVVSSTPETVSR
jgi:hypothetical protein